MTKLDVSKNNTPIQPNNNQITYYFSKKKEQIQTKLSHIKTNKKIGIITNLNNDVP
jgi:hypothetical protein